MAKPPLLQSKAARNERRKAAANTLVAIGIALLAATLFQPVATARLPHPIPLVGAVLMFVASQAFAHYILSRIED